jgi:type IV pilus assembly protein PilN
MKQPQNQSVLARSQFLNALFASKSFSWTAVMMDLEKVLPNGVQVTSIDPVISKEGDVSIRLRVTGDRDKAIQLVRNLETAQRFVAPRLGGETALTAEKVSALGRGPAPGFGPGARGAETDAVLGNGVEFEIFSGYNPLPRDAGNRNAGKREEGRGKSDAAKKPVVKAVPRAPKAKTVLPPARPAAPPLAARPLPKPAGGVR